VLIPPTGPGGSAVESGPAGQARPRGIPTPAGPSPVAGKPPGGTERPPIGDSITSRVPIPATAVKCEGAARSTRSASGHPSPAGGQGIGFEPTPKAVNALAGPVAPSVNSTVRLGGTLCSLGALCARAMPTASVWVRRPPLPSGESGDHAERDRLRLSWEIHPAHSQNVVASTAKACGACRCRLGGPPPHPPRRALNGRPDASTSPGGRGERPARYLHTRRAFPRCGRGGRPGGGRTPLPGWARPSAVSDPGNRGECAEGAWLRGAPLPAGGEGEGFGPAPQRQSGAWRGSGWASCMHRETKRARKSSARPALVGVLRTWASSVVMPGVLHLPGRVELPDLSMETGPQLGFLGQYVVLLQRVCDHVV